MNKTDTFRRRLHNILGTVIMILVLGLTFALPYAAYSYEDYRLTNYDIHYTAEPVNIESDKMSIAEKLSGIGNIVGSSSFIYVYPESLDKRDYAMLLSMDEAREKAVNVYMDVFWCNTFNITSDSAEYKAFKQQLMDDPDMFIQPILLVEPGLKNTFLGWNIGIDNDVYGYSQIIIDDQSGMLISYQGEIARVDNKMSNNVAICDSLGRLYGITYEGVDVLERGENLTIDTMRLRGKSMSMELYLVDSTDTFDAEEGYIETISYNAYSDSSIEELKNE